MYFVDPHLMNYVNYLIILVICEVTFLVRETEDYFDFSWKCITNSYRYQNGYIVASLAIVDALQKRLHLAGMVLSDGNPIFLDVGCMNYVHIHMGNWMLNSIARLRPGARYCVLPTVAELICLLVG